MICELFPFQKQAVNEMRLRVAMALNNYRMLKIPQVVSLQAPTGSGKTIIMSALIEDIFYGSEQFTEQPEAIFVWLSDSPQLNEQSKQKIELKADKVRMDQCVVISDESFDREILEDGHIYFLNTQKLGKAGNLSRHSDTRQYTIWETIENTAREKADRLYFIIDEAHRGMQGRQAGTATTIMQRFIKGSSEQNLSPIPVVIGMSATAERFNSLVGQATSSTLHKVVISPAQVRQSGLLKDRIVITYPEDPIKHGDMAVLQAATDEWQDKCKHWYQYTYEQHYTNVNPVFVIQVCAGSSTKVSDTDLDDVIAKIEERMGDSFKENEVVHTFGSTGTLSIHGLTVPHVEPSEIAEDRRIRVVLFKENLSTGWDCPRAETMMSFRRAEDATYIAQLLGRMVRTPLQCHVLVDDSLNDVRLFLPYFNQDTVQKVIDELQATEGGEIPTVVDGESLEDQTYDTWSVHTQRKKTQKQTVGQLSIFDYPNGFQEEPAAAPSTAVGDMSNSGAVAANQGGADSEIPAEGQHQTIPLETVSGNDVHAGQETERTGGGNQSVNKEQPVLTPAVSQMSMLPTIDREGITKFINEQGYLTYIVRAVKINSYLKSLMSLAGLLSQFNAHAAELRSILLTESREAKGQALEKTKADIDKYLCDVEYWNQFKEPEVDHKLHYWKIDNWGEKIFGSHGVLFLGAFMDNTKFLFPVLLLCDENGEYINFTEDEIVSALEEANDSDVRYFKPTEEEQSYFHRIYTRLISEVQDQHDKTVAPTIAYNKKKIENWVNIQQEQLHVQLTDAQKEVEEYILAEMAATDTLEKKDIRKKAAEAKKKMDKLQHDLPKRRKEIQDEAQAEIDRFNQSQEINPLLLINIVLKF